MPLWWELWRERNHQSQKNCCLCRAICWHYRCELSSSQLFLAHWWFPVPVELAKTEGKGGTTGEKINLQIKYKFERLRKIIPSWQTIQVSDSLPNVWPMHSCLFNFQSFGATVLPNIHKTCLIIQNMVCLINKECCCVRTFFWNKDSSWDLWMASAKASRTVDSQL